MTLAASALGFKMSFKNIQGQDKPIQRLQGLISRKQLVGSYLFIGPEGIGKKMSAIASAKALNCQKETVEACNTCASCLKIDKSGHPDMHLIEAGSDLIKIEYIRQFQRDISLRPYEGRVKVFIIDNAHNLTAEAANALLKVLEEPPKDSLIILISAKPALLFKTIISRCQIIKFHILERATLEEILRRDYALDDNSAHFAAYFSEGRIGYALKLKEAENLLVKNRIIDELVSGRGAGTLAFERLAAQDKESLRNNLNILASWFRDIYLVKAGMPQDGLIHLDRKREILKVMHSYTLLDLDEALNTIVKSLSLLEQNINTRLLLSNLAWSLKGS